MVPDLTVEILKEIRDSIRTGNAELRRELVELRAESQKGLSEVRVEIAELRAETREGFVAVRREFDQHARAIHASASDAETRARLETIEHRLSELERRGAS
jgi:hypothetical protein